MAGLVLMLCCSFDDKVEITIYAGTRYVDVLGSANVDTTSLLYE